MTGSSPDRCKDYLPIRDYAVIGDCHTAALVGRNGSIDWYCPGRFDASAVFCRLLDAEKGGFFRLAPAEAFSSEREYRGATNVLQTTFTTNSGQVRVTDFMAIEPGPRTREGCDVAVPRRIIRLLEGLSGEMDVALQFRPTFDYARAGCELSLVTNVGAVAQASKELLILACTDVDLQPDGAGGLQGQMHIAPGERRWVVLTCGNEGNDTREALRPSGCDQQLARTLSYWDHWAAYCTYQGPYRPEVLRSALALKLLIYEPTGAIVAAPTTSLPEDVGGVRNWDYRYTWLRDTSLILYALMTIGYQAEAKDFLQWLRRTHEAEARSGVQIMYTVTGERDVPEMDLNHLDGYRCSRPVRIGNEAAKQFQLDIYGELLTAAYSHYTSRIHRREGTRVHLFTSKPPNRRAWALLRDLVEDASKHWREPDSGIWEMRQQPKRYLHSQLMCWVALDRGIRLAEEYSLPAPLEEWRRTRHKIRRAILTEGYDSKRGTFVQAFGSSALDASALAIPRVGFLPPTDPRVQSTIEHIRTDLTERGLVCRYRTPDGLPDGEGAFALCSLWLVDDLALSGRLEEAHNLFECVAGAANDVGLLSEEIDPSTGELLGNFPQGFTHLALIRSAVNLAKAAKHGPEERAETEAERAAKAQFAATQGWTARAERA